MGWVVEQAGGRASTGAGAMLDQEVGSVCAFLVKYRLRPHSLFLRTDAASRGVVCFSSRPVYSLPHGPSQQYFSFLSDV